MKQKLFCMLVCSAILIGGCGNAKTTTSTTTSVSEATSVPAASESEASSVPKPYADAPTADDTTSTAEDFSEFVTLADYKNLKILAAEGAAAENGNTVNIDYAGTIDGVAFDGGTAQQQDLELGSHTFIEGFEDQLVGHKVGDTVDVVVTFPDDYGVDSLNGKEAHFKTTINTIYIQSVEQAFYNLIQASTINTYPKDIIDKWTEGFTSGYKAAAEENGQSVEDYMKAIGYTEDMLETNVKSYAQSELVARAILHAEGITKDSEEYKASQGALKTQMGIMSAEQAKQMGYQDADIEFLTIYQTALDVLLSYSAS